MIPKLPTDLQKIPNRKHIRFIFTLLCHDLKYAGQRLGQFI